MVAVVLVPFFLAGCASWKSAGSTTPGAPPEYVEVDNPMVTATPGAPATIWVPAKAEGGIPRGGELLKQGVSQLKQGVGGAATTAAAAPAVPPAGVPLPAAATAAPPPAPGQIVVPVPAPVVQYQVVQQPARAPLPVRKQIAIFESGQNGLIALFSDQIRGQGIGVPIDITAQMSGTRAAVQEQERPAYVGELWKDNVAAVLVVLTAPEGVGPGKTLFADIYDGIEKSRLRRVSTQIPAAGGTLPLSCGELAFRVGEVVNLTPWYGRIFALEGERVYVNAGRESGIQIGQKLKVYRGGKSFPGVGFDPGTQVATLEIAGFVGTNGSYGIAKDGQGVQLSDIVASN